MKKIYLFILAFCALMISSMNLQAQTDVTSTYLTNAGFDLDPICYTVAGGATRNTNVTRVGTTGWIFEIPNWTSACVIGNNAVQVATGQYGITTTNVQGFNNVLPPATDKNGVSTGACLAMSAGWGDDAIYYQTVTLPSGRYALKYDAYNANASATSCNVNFTGFVPDAGTATYSSKLTFPVSTWVTDSVSFYLTADNTSGRINLGFTTSSGSSGAGVKLFVDNVKLIFYGVDKLGLKALIDSATVMSANPQNVGTSTVYADLNTALATAQEVYNAASSTAASVVAQETALKAVISNVKGAITLQTRVSTWTTFPYDATSAISNPSFELDLNQGWTNTGGFARQNNTSFDPKKIGTYYAEKWITSGTSLSNIKLTQTVKNIPNGLYLLKASAHAIQQTGTVYPGGAYIFANADSTEVFAINDYSVTTTVTNNTLEVGFVVKTTGNWVAMDNFTLTYVSDGSPYLIVDPTTLGFTPNVYQKSIVIKGGNLTSAVALSTSSNSFSLSRTSVPASEAMSATGAEIQVISNATSTIPNDTLFITCGTAVQKVLLTLTQSDITLSSAGLFFDQSMAATMTFNVSGDLFSDITLTAPAGITLSDASISTSNAYATKTVTATWDQSTRVVDKYIRLASGTKSDSILVFAVSDNVISAWDGDNAEGTGSKLTDFGWSHTAADGITDGGAAFGDFAGTGVRYVTATNAAHTYKGKPWLGHRVAYLRTWGATATNVFNLEVNLQADKTYVFRGVAGWHNNENNPTFKFAINKAKANLGDTLAIQSLPCTIKQRGEDLGFEFTPTTTDTYYFTVSSTAINDAMCGVDFLSIYPKNQINTDVKDVNKSDIMVYPTVTDGEVKVKLGANAGTIKVYDIAGKLINTRSASARIEVVTLPSVGVYIVEVNSNNVTKRVKVVKTK